MLYLSYQFHVDFVAPIRALARTAHSAIALRTALLNPTAAAWELIARGGLSHARPDYGIDHIVVGGEEMAVTEEPVLATPFSTLLHFRKAIDARQPRVLVVAPLSGHFATLLRGTIRTLLADHDVYVTDWHNARDVALTDGRFGFDDYVDHIIRFLEAIGPGAHVLAVCQPCVQVLAASR
jgi:polyhydroxyalkanoate depolymerase